MRNRVTFFLVNTVFQRTFHSETSLLKQSSFLVEPIDTTIPAIHTFLLFRRTLQPEKLRSLILPWQTFLTIEVNNIMNDV